MQLLFRMPIGIFSDMLKKRKPFILFGMLTSTLSCLIFAITDQLGWILAARSLAGLAAAAWVVFSVLYSSYFSDRHIARAMGSISLIVVLAQFFGMFVSGFIIEQWGWKSPFWIGTSIGLIGIILAVFIFEPQKAVVQEPLKLKDLSTVMYEPMLIKVSMLSIVAHGIIFTTMFGFTPTYALEVGFKADAISLIVICFMVPHAISTVLSGKYFVPKFGHWKTLQLAFGSVGVFTFLIPFAQTKVMLCILQVFNGFGLGLLYPLLLAMAIETIAPQKRATAMGIYQALYAVGMFVFPFLGGLLNSYMGIGGAFYLSGIFGLVAALFSAVWGYQSVRRRKAGDH